MAILSETDTTTLNEIRWEIYPELTQAELPDAVITRRTIFRAANRETLKIVGLTATEYTALEADDARREICEEATIKRCAHDLIPTVAQIVTDNENGLMTRYQEIDWQERQKLLAADITRLLGDYAIEDIEVNAWYAAGKAYFQTISRTKEEC